MVKTTISNYDRDAAWGNDRLNVHTLAIEILRQHQGPSILTMAEAVTLARQVGETDPLPPTETVEVGGTLVSFAKR